MTDFQKEMQKTKRTHAHLMEENPVYNFIESNRPAEGGEAVFFSYEHISNVSGLILPPDCDPAVERRDFVQGMLEQCFEFLWKERSIAVQIEARHNNTAGIRIINVV